MSSLIPANTYFIPFEGLLPSCTLPEQFTFLVDNVPHPLCLLAAHQLQAYLATQQDWQHNFGLVPAQSETIIGKMFGVLVVKNEQHELGFLSAFSGKLAGSNVHTRFVPPIFDALTDNSFLNEGMKALKSISDAINSLAISSTTDADKQIHHLKALRKAHSIDLQNQLFDHYHFLNSSGTTKSLRELFQDASYKSPPSGAGECAAPKLLQYAFQNQLKPLAIAEFWWGQSPKSAYWKHAHFYNPCKEKCAPILAHMLLGINS
jgi:tRNA pseudouridine32 synthase/23S rRNA pseudouridine746 synthase